MRIEIHFPMRIWIQENKINTVRIQVDTALKH